MNQAHQKRLGEFIKTMMKEPQVVNDHLSIKNSEAYADLAQSIGSNSKHSRFYTMAKSAADRPQTHMNA